MATWSALSARHENECWSGGHTDSVVAYGVGFSASCIVCEHSYEVNLEGEVTGYDIDEDGCSEVIAWDTVSVRCPACDDLHNQDIDLGSHQELEIETI